MCIRDSVIHRLVHRGILEGNHHTGDKGGVQGGAPVLGTGIPLIEDVLDVLEAVAF